MCIAIKGAYAESSPAGPALAIGSNFSGSDVSDSMPSRVTLVASAFLCTSCSFSVLREL